MTRRGWALFLAMSVLWGIPYLFIKIAVTELSPIVVVFGRVSIAALVLVPIAAHRRVLRLPRNRWLPVLGLALVQIVGPFLLISYGEQHISSSLASLLIAADPLLVAILALWLDHRERVGGVRLFGLLIGFTGVAVLLGIDAGGDRWKLLGAGMVLLAAGCYATGALMLRRRTYAELPALGVVSAECVLATVLLTPATLVALPAKLPSVGAIASLVVLGLLCTALAWLAFFALVDEVGASRGTVFTYVNPAVSVLLGVTLLSEPLTAATVAGFLLVVAGSWLSTSGTLPPFVSRVLGRVRPARRDHPTGLPRRFVALPERPDLEPKESEP